MPFMKAGFNGRHVRTGISGWTRPASGGRFAPAELIRMGSDYAWHGARFLAWGESCVLGSRPEFVLPDEAQHGLPQSPVERKPRFTGKVCLTILGEPASKANSRDLVMIGPRHARRPMFIKSEKARDYEEDALRQIPPAARVRIEGPVRATIRIFYVTHRPDLDEALVLDVLQDRYEGSAEKRVLVQRGVYRNDRQVREKHVYHAIDKVNPRAEIEIEPLEGELFERQQEVDLATFVAFIGTAAGLAAMKERLEACTYDSQKVKTINQVRAESDQELDIFVAGISTKEGIAATAKLIEESSIDTVKALNEHLKGVSF